jgi:hypothetical protein
VGGNAGTSNLLSGVKTPHQDFEMTNGEVFEHGGVPDLSATLLNQIWPKDGVFAKEGSKRVLSGEELLRSLRKLRSEAKAMLPSAAAAAFRHHKGLRRDRTNYPSANNTQLHHLFEDNYSGSNSDDLLDDIDEGEFAKSSAADNTKLMVNLLPHDDYNDDVVMTPTRSNETSETNNTITSSDTNDLTVKTTARNITESPLGNATTIQKFSSSVIGDEDDTLIENTEVLQIPTHPKEFGKEQSKIVLDKSPSLAVNITDIQTLRKNSTQSNSSISTSTFVDEIISNYSSRNDEQTMKGVDGKSQKEMEEKTFKVSDEKTAKFEEDNNHQDENEKPLKENGEKTFKYSAEKLSKEKEKSPKGADEKPGKVGNEKDIKAEDTLKVNDTNSKENNETSTKVDGEEKSNGHKTLKVTNDEKESKTNAETSMNTKEEKSGKNEEMTTKANENSSKGMKDKTPKETNGKFMRANNEQLPKAKEDKSKEKEEKSVKANSEVKGGQESQNGTTNSTSSGKPNNESKEVDDSLASGTNTSSQTTNTTDQRLSEKEKVYNDLHTFIEKLVNFDKQHKPIEGLNDSLNAKTDQRNLNDRNVTFDKLHSFVENLVFLDKSIYLVEHIGENNTVKQMKSLVKNESQSHAKSGDSKHQIAVNN